MTFTPDLIDTENGTDKGFKSDSEAGDFLSKHLSCENCIPKK